MKQKVVFPGAQITYLIWLVWSGEWMSFEPVCEPNNHSETHCEGDIGPLPNGLRCWFMIEYLTLL